MSGTLLNIRNIAENETDKNYGEETHKLRFKTNTCRLLGSDKC